MNVSIVIPVYRSADLLKELYERITDAMAALGMTYEVIFIDDCGGDNSWDLICHMSKLDERVRGIKMGRNFGQHGSILAGVRSACGEVVITMDDDLQHPPEEISKLLNHMRAGDYDVVYGSPIKQRHSVMRNIASKITKMALYKAMNAETANEISAFRVFRTSLRDAFGKFGGPSANIDVLLTWGTSNFGSIQLRHEERKNGASGYSTGKLITHAINMMTGFSTLPLRIASLTGVFFTIFGGCTLFYAVYTHFTVRNSVPGFPFTVSLISIFSGAQLVALGIIGEYLGRIYQRTMERPSYHIAKTSGKNVND